MVWLGQFRYTKISPPVGLAIWIDKWVPYAFCASLIGDWPFMGTGHSWVGWFGWIGGFLPIAIDRKANWSKLARCIVFCIKLTLGNDWFIRFFKSLRRCCQTRIVNFSRYPIIFNPIHILCQSNLEIWRYKSAIPYFQCLSHNSLKSSSSGIHPNKKEHKSKQTCHEKRVDKLVTIRR
jgi:hypothetical protein